jgi:hypothetical protein
MPPTGAVLPGEPAYFRKELHFFDDDLRYTRGLNFYAAHFPRCARDAAAGAPTPQYWRGAPGGGVEVLLEDARSGEAVGWDAELYAGLRLEPQRSTAAFLIHYSRVGPVSDSNVPTNAHNTVLLVPAEFTPRNGTAPPPLVQGSGASRARQAYKLIDAATSQQLYLREWVLRAAPLSQPDDPSQRFYLLPVC